MPIIFDIETQNTFQEVGGRYPHKLRISVAVTYDTAEAAFHRYTADEAAQLAQDLTHTDLVVGYNLLGFDYPVLQRYAPPDLTLSALPTLDILAEIHKRLGFRLKLDNVASATLQESKSADGLQAVRWWKQGRIEEIFRYCEQDVEITRRVYEFGKTHGYLQYYDRRYRLRKVPVAF